MELKHFQSLIEIQRIDSSLGQQKKIIISCEDRLKKIEHERAQRQTHLESLDNEIDALKKKIKQEERSLYDYEKRIEKSKTNITLVKTSKELEAIEKELEVLTPKREESESLSLSLMEKLEQVEQESKDTKKFLEGSLKTLNELRQEVAADIAKAQQEMTGLQERFNNLLSLLPPIAKDTFLGVNRRYQYNNPLSFLDNGVCNQCHITIGRHLQSQLEHGTLIELCSSCGRLLVPHSAKENKSLY